MQGVLGRQVSRGSGVVDVLAMPAIPASNTRKSSMNVPSRMISFFCRMNLFWIDTKLRAKSYRVGNKMLK